MLPGLNSSVLTSIVCLFSAKTKNSVLFFSVVGLIPRGSYSHSSFAMELQLRDLPNIYPPTRTLVYGTFLPVSLDKFSGDVMEYLELKFF